MSKIKAIMRKYGLHGPYPQEHYVQQMETRFNRSGEKFLNLVDDAIAAGWPLERYRRVYNAQHSHAAMSLYVSSHQYSQVYEHVLNWMDRNLSEVPQSFTDLGCGNGLLTLCLSDLWPEARGYGVDQLQKAISVAKRLASQFDNQRTSFFKADFTVPDSTKKIPEAPLVIAAFLFHEVLRHSPQAWENISSNISALMQDSGQLISINRFPQPRWEVPLLNERLEYGALRPVSQDSLKMGTETFPIVVYEKFQK